MSDFGRLPLYKAAYDFLIDIIPSVNKFSREYKYLIGERIQITVIDLVVDIYKANSGIDEVRADYLKSILEKLQYVNLYLRMCLDLRLITPERYGDFVLQVHAILKQAKGWLKSTIDAAEKKGIEIDIGPLEDEEKKNKERETRRKKAAAQVAKIVKAYGDSNADSQPVMLDKSMPKEVQKTLAIYETIGTDIQPAHRSKNKPN